MFGKKQCSFSILRMKGKARWYIGSDFVTFSNICYTLCQLCCSTNQKLNRSELVSPSSVYENLYILADLAQPIINLEDHARESVSSLSAYGRKQNTQVTEKTKFCSLLFIPMVVILYIFGWKEISETWMENY